MKTSSKSILFAAIGLLIGLLLAAPLRSWWQHLRTASSEAHSNGDANAAKGDETQWYISGMHPWIIQPGPGNCPVCGMELTPLSAGMLTGELAIDPLLVQNIGVRVATVEEGPLQTRLRTMGTVEFDERKRHAVVLRAAGYIERLHVRYIGQSIEAGAVIAEVHSPEILAALNELRSLRVGGSESAQVAATRSRLRVLGLTQDQIDSLEHAESTPWTIELTSPQGGVVTRLGASEGNWLASGGELIEVTGLETVWAIATVFESQLERIREGMQVEARLQNQPQHTLRGTIEYRYPTLDPRTRQGRARVTLDNPEGLLKPGMFLRLEMDDTLAENVLHVPREAVLDTGMRQMAYVSLGDGKFDPRTVRVGVETSEGRIAIHEGLSKGEQVVVSGQFLLDSESRLRESLLKLVGGESAAAQEVQAPVAAAADLAALPNEHGEALAALIAAYLDIAAPLVDDHLRGIREATAELKKAMERMAALPVPAGNAEAYPAEQLPLINAAAAKLEVAESPSAARMALRDLSDALRTVLHATGVPSQWPGALHEVRCPMFPSLGENAWWFQRATTTANPYMGQAMLTCHDQRYALPRSGDSAVQSAAVTAAPAPSEPNKAAEVEPVATPEAVAKARGEISSFASMQLTKDGQAALADALRAYLASAERLVADSLEDLAEQGQALNQAMTRLRDHGTADDAHAFHRDDLTKRTRDAAGRLDKARDLESARMALAILAEELIGWVQATGVPDELEISLQAARCHMFPEHGSYGWWIQAEGPLENPLWGPAMLRCADQVVPLGETENSDSTETKDERPRSSALTPMTYDLQTSHVAAMELTLIRRTSESAGPYPIAITRGGALV